MSSSKLKFFSALLVSVILAACAGNDTSEEVAQEPVAAENTGAQVDPYASEQVQGGAMDTDNEPAVQLVTVFYFDFDQSSLSASTRADLDAVASFLKKSGAKVRLEGHADERGTREYNLALGERRAQAVANYLAVQGVSKSQLEIISYGEEKPAVLGSSESSWAKNRRVELVK